MNNIVLYEKHADAQAAIEEWYEKTKQADWSCFADIKNTFNSVDGIGNQRFIFNIKGNDYRLVTLVIFKTKMVYIRFIATHKEYNNIDCSNI